LEPQYVIEARKILELGVPPLRVHIMTQVSGIGWDEAWASRANDECGGVPVPFIGREALIANKTASGRPKDLADVAALEGRDR
jgi:hypothetical protein